MFRFALAIALLLNTTAVFGEAWSPYHFYPESRGGRVTQPYNPIYYGPGVDEKGRNYYGPSTSQSKSRTPPPSSSAPATYGSPYTGGYAFQSAGPSLYPPSAYYPPYSPNYYYPSYPSYSSNPGVVIQIGGFNNAAIAPNAVAVSSFGSGMQSMLGMLGSPQASAVPTREPSPKEQEKEYRAPRRNP